MNIISKTLLSVALTASLGVASTAAMANFIPNPLYNQFAVDPTNTNNGGVAPGVTNTATNVWGDVLKGTYNETITLDFSNNTFGASLLFLQTAINNQPTSGSTQSNIAPNLYITALITGSFSTGVSSTIFSADAGSLTAYYAPYTSVATVAPSDGYAVYGTNLPTTTVVATGNDWGGQGQAANGTTNFGIGFFALKSNLALASGQGYFTAPNPFYNVAFETGQFNSLTFQNAVGSKITYISDGTADITFGNVPEPASLALVGAGLLGLAFRRRNQA